MSEAGGNHHRVMSGILPKGSAVFIIPVLALLFPFAATLIDAQPVAGDLVRVVVASAAAGLLLVNVFASLHHAETVAARMRDPFGTLVLTIAVTIIEVSIIVSMMLHGASNPTLARESVFSVVMIILSGVVGTCLTVGALRYREQELKQQATSSFLGVLIALCVMVLVLPNYAGGAGIGSYGPAQLIFVCIASALLYGAFLLMQTGRHRTDFVEAEIAEDHHEKPTPRAVLLGALFLVGGLVAVVLLAEMVAADVENGLSALQVQNPDRIVGAFVACLVLLPETVAAIRAASANRLQRSINIALGSALATIGLTIPSVAMVALVTGSEITLGLNPADTVMLILTLALSIVSFGTGRTNMMTGLVHLVVFAAYVLFLIRP